MLRVGLIGYGFAGSVFHAPILPHAGLKLQAVASSRPDVVHKDWPDAVVHPTSEALCADPDVDLVVIAAPAPLHTDLMVMALEAGKHVVTDKPFSFTVEDAERAIAARDKAGKTLSCFQNRRWDSDFLTLRALIEGGELGEIMSYRGHFEFFFPIGAGDRGDALGDPIQFELGAHQFDQVYTLFGKPDWVFGDLTLQRDGGKAIDRMIAVLGYGEKLRVELVGSFLVPDHSSRYAIHGTKGSYMKSHMDVQEAQLISGMTPADPQYGREPEDHQAMVTRVAQDGSVETVRHPSIPGNFPQFYRELAEAIETGGTPPVTAEQARDVIGIIQAVGKSNETGQRIYL